MLGINKPHFLHTLNCGYEVLSQLVASAQGAALILHPLKMLHLSLWKFSRFQWLWSNTGVCVSDLPLFSFIRLKVFSLHLSLGWLICYLYVHMFFSAIILSPSLCVLVLQKLLIWLFSWDKGKQLVSSRVIFCLPANWSHSILKVILKTNRLLFKRLGLGSAAILLVI